MAAVVAPAEALASVVAELAVLAAVRGAGAAVAAEELAVACKLGLGLLLVAAQKAKTSRDVWPEDVVRTTS